MKAARERRGITLADSDDVRLRLDAAWNGPRPAVRSRIRAAVVDAGIILILTVAVVWPADVDWSWTTAIVTLAYFSLGTALFGVSPAQSITSGRPSAKKSQVVPGTNCDSNRD